MLRTDFAPVWDTPAFDHVILAIGLSNMSTQRLHNFVGEKTQTNMSRGWITSTNPYNEETWAKIPQGSAKVVDVVNFACSF